MPAGQRFGPSRRTQDMHGGEESITSSYKYEVERERYQCIMRIQCIRILRMPIYLCRM